MKNVSLKMPDRTYEKLENYKKENNITMTQAIISLIEKGFIKKSNDYAELINFFKENFNDKHKDELLKITTEFTRIETALKKIYDKVSTGKPAQETKKLTAADMSK
jgi:hypothetical protein